MTERKRIAILGSTGSIGRQTLDVVAWHPDRFEVVALAARSDAPLFRQQVEQFKPKLAALTGASQDGWSPDETRLCFGEPSLVEIATAPDVDVRGGGDQRHGRAGADDRRAGAGAGGGAGEQGSADHGRAPGDGGGPPLRRLDHPGRLGAQRGLAMPDSARRGTESGG